MATPIHPFANHSAINFDEIKSTPIIMFPETHRCRQLIDMTCSSAGFKLLPLIETTTIESLFGLVRSGAGATIVSRTLLEMYNNGDLIMIPIENARLCREIGIVFHRDKHIGKAAKGFIDILTAHVEKR